MGTVDYTQTALSFIDSNTVRNTLRKAGIKFSAENTLPLVFHSDRPQNERFPVMLEILRELNTPEALQLAEILRQQVSITDPTGNPHYIFREKYTENPRKFLTAAQLKRWLESAGLAARRRSKSCCRSSFRLR